jgi:hypothetical protein
MMMLSTEKALRSLRKTPAVRDYVVRDVDQSRAQVARDGADGWNVLEIVCHLNDLEAVYTGRARQILEQDNPHFAPVDQVGLVTANRYAEQNFRQVLAQFHEGRAAFLALLESLTPEQWERHGVHPETGDTTLREMAINTALHDLNHIEQIVKALVG